VKLHNKKYLFSIHSHATDAIQNHRKFFTKQPLILVGLILMLGVHHSHAQALQDASDTTVLKADKIIWYGLDLSHMKINDAAKLGEGEKITAHLPELFARTNKHYGTKWFSKRIIKRSVVIDIESVQSFWVNEEELMTNQPFNFPADSISSFVARYQPAESAGVGLVLIIENFDKPAKRISGYFTFFDISTHKILDVIKFKGNAGQPGGATSYIDWWWPSIEELFNAFDKKYIRPLLNTHMPSATGVIQDPVQATKKTKQFISLHLGITNTKLAGSDIDLIQSEFRLRQHSKPGVDIAFTYKWEPSSYFYFKTGAGYVSKKNDMEGTPFVYPLRAKLQFIDVPLIVGFQPINIKNSKVLNFGIESGVIGNFDVGSTSNDSGLNSDNKLSPKSFVPAFAFGGNLEIKVSKKFFVFVNYRVCKDLVDNRAYAWYRYGQQGEVLVVYSYRAVSNNLTFGILMRLN
jgi:hypothetical protein